MKQLVRGEKVKLADYTSAQTLEVEVQIASDFDIDITCFGLDANKRLADDRYMIFYNQLQSPADEIRLDSSSNGRGSFSIDLSKLPPSVQYLVFTATIDGHGTMGTIQAGAITIKSGGQPILNYELKAADFNNEKAIIITEMYYKSLWRVAAVGQGFDGGLAALLKSFGGEVGDLSGRYIDNADFFSAKNPAAVSDDELYDLLMQEYPERVKNAHTKGLI